MTDKPHIVLLPGLDGTGELFFPIVPLLENHFEVHSVSYTNELTFDDYVESAQAQLPANGPVSLVAESFSGPIAITLLSSNSSNFQASVLSATFCRSPLPLLTQVSKYLPEKLFSSNPASKVFLDYLVTGSDADSRVRKKALEILEMVSPSQFQNRINIVNEVNVTDTLKDIEVPLLYIQATRDRIVFSRSGTEMTKHAKNLRLTEVDGAHMILQTQPEKCAELIISHVTSNE
ncbi:MAG: hypothetical protein GY703_13330 [Gammaproteobacteria bacterium]|nr:hypothetical protein [Gammaproteobacteria bacterium]